MRSSRVDRCVPALRVRPDLSIDRCLSRGRVNRARPKSHPSRPFYSLFLRLFSLDISRAYVHILLSIIIINDLLLHLIHCLYQRVKKFVERIVEIGDAIKIGEKEKIKEEGETRPNSQLRDINDSSSG